MITVYPQGIRQTHAPVLPFRLRCHAAAVDVFGPEHAGNMRRDSA